MVSMHGFRCAQLGKTDRAPHTKCRDLKGNYARLGFGRGVFFFEETIVSQHELRHSIHETTDRSATRESGHPVDDGTVGKRIAGCESARIAPCRAHGERNDRRELGTTIGSSTNSIHSALEAT
jgi:hypothetical protein